MNNNPPEHVKIYHLSPPPRQLLTSLNYIGNIVWVTMNFYSPSLPTSKKIYIYIYIYIMHTLFPFSLLKKSFSPSPINLPLFRKRGQSGVEGPNSKVWALLVCILIQVGDLLITAVSKLCRYILMYRKYVFLLNR